MYQPVLIQTAGACSGRTTPNAYRIEPAIGPDLDDVRAYMTETWEIQATTLELAVEQLDQSTPLSVAE